MVSISRRTALAGLGASLAAPSIARAQAPAKTSVGVLRLSSSGPVFVAAERGYWRDLGLDVELKYFTAAQQVPVAVTSNDAEFGVTGLTAAFYNLAGRGALKIVASQARDEKGFPLTAFMATNAAYERGLRGGNPKVPFSQPRINQDRGLKHGEAMSFRVNHHRDRPLGDGLVYLLQRCTARLDAFNDGSVMQHRHPITHRRSHHRRLSQLGHDDWKTSFDQAIRYP